MRGYYESVPLDIPQTRPDGSGGTSRFECPSCRSPLHLDDEIFHDPDERCPHRFPVIDGVPRFVLGHELRRVIMKRHPDWGAAGGASGSLRAEWASGSAPSSLSEQVSLGFDEEWRRFDQIGTPELAEIFAQYFDLVSEEAFSPDHRVLDAGSGSGRWAVEVARRGPRVLAVDMGMSVELARRHSARTTVEPVQADVAHLPLPAGSVDWAYSLGVLHHTADPLAALRNIVDAVKPGGFVLVYLYYALDNRGWAYRSIFRLVDVARRIVATFPRPIIHWLGFLIAATVYLPLSRLSRALHRLGLSDASAAMPLAFYRERSFRIMWNDAVDRFGTRVERRYRREQVVALLSEAGLDGVRVSPSAPYWKALGRKPSG